MQPLLAGAVPRSLPERWSGASRGRGLAPHPRARAEQLLGAPQQLQQRVRQQAQLCGRDKGAVGDQTRARLPAPRPSTGNRTDRIAVGAAGIADALGTHRRPWVLGTGGHRRRRAGWRPPVAPRAAPRPEAPCSWARGWRGPLWSAAGACSPPAPFPPYWAPAPKSCLKVGLSRRRRGLGARGEDVSSGSSQSCGRDSAEGTIGIQHSPLICCCSQPLNTATRV